VVLLSYEKVTIFHNSGISRNLDGERVWKVLLDMVYNSLLSKMSRCQCCVWGCHNRKGRCAKDVDGNRLCECSILRNKNCPKRDILSLHTIDCMPQQVQRAVIQKINLTRQGPRGTKWKPTKETVICNVHYAGFKGPTKDNKDDIPINFKRPAHILQLLQLQKGRR